MRNAMIVIAIWCLLVASAFAQTPQMDLPPEDQSIAEATNHVQLGGYGELHYNNKEGVLNFKGPA